MLGHVQPCFHQENGKLLYDGKYDTLALLDLDDSKEDITRLDTISYQH